MRAPPRNHHQEIPGRKAEFVGEIWKCPGSRNHGLQQGESFEGPGGSAMPKACPWNSEVWYEGCRGDQHQMTTGAGMECVGGGDQSGIRGKEHAGTCRWVGGVSGPSGTWWGASGVGWGWGVMCCQGLLWMRRRTSPTFWSSRFNHLSCTTSLCPPSAVSVSAYSLRQIHYEVKAFALFFPFDRQKSMCFLCNHVNKTAAGIHLHLTCQPHSSSSITQFNNALLEKWKQRCGWSCHTE